MKKNISVLIEEEIIEQVRDLVYWTPNLTVSSVTEEALKNYLKDHPVEKRGQGVDLKRGRPVNRG